MFCAQASLNRRCGPKGPRPVTTIAVNPLPAACEMNEMKWNEMSKIWVFYFYETYVIGGSLD